VTGATEVTEVTPARPTLTTNRTRNRALLRHVVLPTLFLTAALLGGLRVAAESRAFVFVAPPLVTLVLAVMLLALFARGGALKVGRWLSADNGTAENVSHALTLGALFFASAQAFNSVLPDAGLPRLVLACFFLWTLWQNQFSNFDPRRLLRSLAALFGTAFLVKHLLLASLSAPAGGWLSRLAAAALEGVTLGTLSGPAYAASTGYVSFFALALYACGLALTPPAPSAEPDDERDGRAAELARGLKLLPARERALVIEEFAREAEREREES
jgi:hypothetical protein